MSSEVISGLDAVTPTALAPSIPFLLTKVAPSNVAAPTALAPSSTVGGLPGSRCGTPAPLPAPSPMAL